MEGAQVRLLRFILEYLAEAQKDPQILIVPGIILGAVLLGVCWLLGIQIE
jgi:hypothetical protein